MLTFDLSAFDRAARRLGALERQIPFALSGALNKAADLARKELIDTTWAQHVTVRNPNFLKAALTTRGKRATKKALRVELYDKLGRGSLIQHARGGTKKPKGRHIAVAPSGALRGPKGIPKGMRPRAITATTPARALRVTDRGIFVGQGGRLHLKYTLKPNVQIKPTVPFEQDFGNVMRRELPRQFVTSLRRAMATARR